MRVDRETRRIISEVSKSGAEAFLEDIDFYDYPIVSNNKKWVYCACALASPNSLHTSIGDTQEIGTRDPYTSWLDFHNLGKKPLTARSLIYLGADEDVSLKIKLERVRHLTQSFLVYETIMENVPPDTSKKQLKELLLSGKLPRPEEVELVWSSSDGGLGLNFVAEELDPNNTYKISWSQLLGYCKSGELVETWKRLVLKKSKREIMFAKPQKDPNMPEVFYKDEFCFALAGLRVSEIRGRMSDYIKSFDSKPSVIGRDTPRTEADKLVDRTEIFMNTIYTDFSQLDSKSPEQLFAIFQCFMKYEKYVHMNSGDNYRKFYDPVYEMIEDGYKGGDDETFKTAILLLLNNIIHE